MACALVVILVLRVAEPPVLAPLALVLAIYWGVLSVKIGKRYAELQYVECLRQVNCESLARMRRDWDQIPLVRTEIPQTSRARQRSRSVRPGFAVPSGLPGANLVGN